MNMEKKTFKIERISVILYFVRGCTKKVLLW